MTHSSALPLALAGGALTAMAIAFVALAIQALFLLWGARIAGIERRSFGRALAVVFLGGLASGVVSLLAAASIGPLTPIVALVGGFAIEAVVAMPVFRTTFGRALGATVLAWIFSLLILGAVVLVLVLLGVGLSLAA